MYAVIRAGGKQYRVAPGDVIKVETVPVDNGTVEFSDVLAVSSEQGKIGAAKGETRVVGQVVEEGRGDKILVFHYKRKKQYKKLQGHRQNFTAVRITEITYNGEKFSAPALPEKKVKAPAAKAEPAAEAAPAKKTAAKKAPAKKSAAKKTPAKKK